MALSDGEYSVAIFYTDETYEYVRRWVDDETAARSAKAYTEGVGAKIGIIRRVIMTDGGDNTNFEWKYGEGITYPPGVEEQLRRRPGGS